MKVRIRRKGTDLRLEALHLAVKSEATRSLGDVVDRARRFYDFLTGDRETEGEPNHDG